MRSKWNPKRDPNLLDRFAEGPIEYEVRMMLQQFGHLEPRWAAVKAERDRGRNADLGADGQALFEAVLVHLRLLDEFLGDPRQTKRLRKTDTDDVFACHWDRRRHPRWTPSRFLSNSTRARMNAKLSHLTGRRVTEQDLTPNELRSLVRKCCERLKEFFDHVDAHNHDRAAAFATSVTRVELFLKGDKAAAS